MPQSAKQTKNPFVKQNNIGKDRTRELSKKQAHPAIRFSQILSLSHKPATQVSFHHITAPIKLLNHHSIRIELKWKALSQKYHINTFA